MSRDRSLDEFVEDEPADADTDADETDPDGTEGEIGDDPDGTPARPTYGWRPDGGACDRCGDRVPDRWRGEGGELVCEACKEW